MKHKYFPLIIVCITLLFEYSHAQTQSQNYVLSRTYRTKGGLVSGGDDKKYWGVPLQVQTQIAYVDGLGKPIQSVLVSGNPLQMDLTAVTGYNNMFQVSKNYLPVALATADGNFHETVSGDYYNDDNKVGSKTGSYWTETLYDKSPLGRVTEGKSPGVATGVRKKYLVYQERTHRAVKRYYFKADGSLETSAVYADNTLNVTETKDENDKKVEEFTDQNGRAILKRVAGDEYTYYVYNGKGQLRYVLQPEYQNYANLDSYAFQYTYDSKGRMVTKKIPGQGSFSMEYYDNDMLKYLVDAKSQRYYYKYDALNRQTEMGIVDGAAEKALLKTKYDDYAGMSENFDNSVFNLTEDDHFIGTPKTDSKKGLVTMISARVLNGGENWLNTVMFYDKKGRLVQTHRGLYELGGQSKEVVSYKLDFVGNILEERTEQFTNAMQYRFDKVFVYDHQNRLRSVKHTLSEVVNNVATVKKSYEHVANRYNEIGLLETKFLHKAVSATDYTQKLKYKYTPRGWLYAIDNNGGTTYQIGLQYNENGNINNFSWQTSGPRSSFSAINYDGSNRLTEASGGTLKESNITYDKNGNILTLKREGAVTDNLTYKYPGKTNRLEGIGNTGANGQGVKNGDSSYGYDSNGNMTSDGNKGAAIAYNFLNLPAQVVLSNPARTINYVYDGAGNKLKMEAVGGTTFYAGAFEYKTDKTLLRIGLEEGQLIKTNDGGYDVNYYLRDHLGNVRMVLKEDGSVLQETEYYAFGLPVPKTGNDAVNKYLYNRKEKQPETGWLDYGARTYMPEIGRWASVDILSEKYFTISPFSFSGNMPFIFTDINGKEIEFGIWSWNGEMRRYDYRKVGFEELDKITRGALNAVAETNVGKAFFAKYARAGDKIGGVNFDKSGELSDHKLQLSESWKGNSTTAFYEDNGKLRMNVDLYLGKGSNQDRKYTEPFAISLGHEITVHADAKDDRYIKSINSGNFKNEIALDVKQNPYGVRDHYNMLYTPGSFQNKQMNLFVNQLKHVLNPSVVDKYRREHDEANALHVKPYIQK